MTPGPVGVVGLRFFCAGGPTRQQPDPSRSRPHNTRAGDHAATAIITSPLTIRSDPHGVEKCSKNAPSEQSVSGRASQRPWPGSVARQVAGRFFSAGGGAKGGGSRRTQMYPFSRCLPLVQGAVRTPRWLPRAPRRTCGLSPAPLHHRNRPGRQRGRAAQERADETSLSPS